MARKHAIPGIRAVSPEAAVNAVQRLTGSLTKTEDCLPSRVPARLPDGWALEEQGRSFEEVVEIVGEALLQTPSAASRCFNNQLFGGRDTVAMMAEMLTALTNTSMYTYKVAGPQVLIEREVLGRMLRVAGFDQGEGVFSPGGSLANLTAMVLARNEALDDVRDRGVSGQRVAVYTSTASHYSIVKNAGLIGIGRDSVRRVEVDGDGRMRPEVLRRTIERDLGEGVFPVMINATAGSTLLGSFDDLYEAAEIASEHRIWLHVDGALGGSVLLCERHRGVMAGIERADSLAWNAHKMMGVPLPCSVLLVRQRGLLARHLHEDADYLFQTEDNDLDPGTRSIQCGRRNDALKLWAAWLHLGDSGFDERIARHFELARYAAGIIEAEPGFELVVRPASVTVCFEVPGVSSAAICDRLDENMKLKIGHGRVGNRAVIRLVCVDPDLDRSRIDEMLREISWVAADLRSEQ